MCSRRRRSDDVWCSDFSLFRFCVEADEDEKTRRREEEMKHRDTKTDFVSCYSDSRAFLFWVSTHYLMNGDEVTSVYSSERFDVLTEESRGQNFNSSFAFKPRSLFPVWTPSCTFISFFCLNQCWQSSASESSRFMLTWKTQVEQTTTVIKKSSD